jgi:hypothetical protein
MALSAAIKLERICGSSSSTSWGTSAMAHVAGRVVVVDDGEPVSGGYRRRGCVANIRRSTTKMLNKISPITSARLFLIIAAITRLALASLATCFHLIASHCPPASCAHVSCFTDGMRLQCGPRSETQRSWICADCIPPRKSGSRQTVAVHRFPHHSNQLLRIDHPSLR